MRRCCTPACFLLTRAYFPLTSVLLPLFKRAQVLQDLGFNFMRVYVAWQGVMPSLGAINTTYLDQVEQVPVYKLKPLLNLHTIPLAP